MIFLPDITHEVTERHYLIYVFISRIVARNAPVGRVVLYGGISEFYKII
jgi:hypothetical protein